MSVPAIITAREYSSVSILHFLALFGEGGERGAI